MGSQMRKNAAWNAFGNIVYLGCQWLVTILVTRLAGYESAGILSLAMSISASFQTLALFGIRNFQVSDINEKYSDSCYVGLRNITCVSALVFCLLFTAVNSYETDTVAATLWFMFFRLAEDYSDVFHGIFQKNGKLYIAGQSFFIKGIALLAGFLGGFFLFGTLSGGLGLMTVLSVCVTVFWDYMLAGRYARLRVREPFGKCFALAKETLPLCIYMFLNSIIATAPKYILEKMCSEELLGAYSSIFAPALLVQAAAQYIYMPFVTNFAVMLGDKDIKGFKSLMNRILLVIAGFGALILTASIVLGDWGLRLLFTETIAPYTDLLFLIIIGTFTTAVNAFYQSAAIVLRLMRQLVLSCSAGFIICCSVSVASIKLWSADGASIGLIAGTVTGAMILHVCVNKKLKELKREVLR